MRLYLGTIVSVQDLFSAIEDGDFERVQSILRADINLINQSDDEHCGSRPLHAAIGCAPDHPTGMQIVTALISAGADVNAIGDYGRFPIHIAVKLNLATVVEELIDAGARVDVSDGYDTPL